MSNLSDGRVTQIITNKLTARGLAWPCRLTVQTINGQVTLSGTVEHAHQIGAATAAASGMAGVQRVINQITLKQTVQGRSTTINDY